LSGDLSIDQTVADPTVANIANTIFGQKNGINRIGLNLGDTTLETGTFRGSNFSIDGYDNAGNLIGQLLSIDRRGGSALLRSGIFQITDAPGPAPGAGVVLNLASTATAATPLNRIAGYFQNSGAGWNILIPNSDPQTGGNAGANFEIFASSDTGTYLPSALIINRATGVVNFSVSPTVAGAPLPFLPLSGGVMTGAINLLPPTLGPEATNKTYVDSMIANLRLFLGTWQVAANNPNLTVTGALTAGDYFIAVTVNPTVPETAPAGVPGIAGQLIANGDIVIWNAGLGQFEIIQGSGLTMAEANGLYVRLDGAAMTGPLVLDATPPPLDNSLTAATTAYVDDAILDCGTF
jgi:hypothetical protein